MKAICGFLVVVALVAGMAGCGGDSYTRPSQPSQNLEIRTWYDLDAVRDNLAGNHTLMNDLDSTTAGYEELASPTANGGKGWDPIGYGWYTGDLWQGSIFTGSLHGQGYQIRDLFIDRPMESQVGLFGFLALGGTIEDLGVTNSAVTGQERVGGLVGWNSDSGVLRASYYRGSVDGARSIGGIVGWNHGIVSNSHYNHDEVLIKGEHTITIGALFEEDFELWLGNGKSLDIKERLSQEDEYYVVNNVSDFRELLAFGQDDSLRFRLMNDLDLGGAEVGLYIPYFAGEFDGNGHRILNLSFNSGYVSTVGLFGFLASTGYITGVGVENANLTGYSYVGGLVGCNWRATVTQSYAAGNVTGYSGVGGLLGANWGTVSNCHSSGRTGWEEYSGAVGGLVGFSVPEGVIIGSSSTSSVTGHGLVGGLVGNNRGWVGECWSVGNATGYLEVGGLIGRNGGTVSNSHSTGTVYGAPASFAHEAGGLVGSNSGAVIASYSTGSVFGSTRAGGFVGCNFGTVRDSYTTGTVTCSWGDMTDVGGFVGENHGGAIISCYSTGSVHYQGVADPTDKGFAGEVYIGGNYEMTGNFWDTETSGQTFTAGDAIGKTTAEMQDISTFSGASWSIIAVPSSGTRNPSYIWNTVDGVTYPFLSWEPVG